MNIAFIGNPNTGKTALINAIAKSDLEVGNWPGVTVEKKEAHFKYENQEINLIDLPGIYTLTPYSLEEKVTVDYLLDNSIDGIINVLDATNLRRNLYLTLSLIDIQKPMVLALNMFDDFKKRGYEVDTKKLSDILGVKIVPTIASKKIGSQKVLESTVETITDNNLPKIQPLQHHIEKEIVFMEHKLQMIDNFNYSPRAFAIKLLEDDNFIKSLQLNESFKNVIEFTKEARKRIEAHTQLPIKTIISNSRYSLIDKILDEVLSKPLMDKVVLSEKIDRIILNKYLAFPIFILVMYMMFDFTFSLSMPLVDWMNNFFTDFIAKYITIVLYDSPEWVKGLVVDGVLNGVGLLLSFLPLLFFLYLFMAILEESGYMSRVSFLLDALAKKLGVKGNAFISMIIGFGCNVPAVYGTRVLTTKRERVITTLMIPFMSCSGRLPIYALFVAIFFKENQALTVLSIYLLGIIAAFLVGFIANKLLPKQQEKPFFLELATYHMPNINSIWILMKPKLIDFIFKAGKFIILASVILWVVISLPLNSTPQTSYLAKGAKTITPIFKPLGFGEHWELVAVLIPGTLAKEVVVGSLGTIYGIESQNKMTEEKADIKNDIRSQMILLKNALRESIFNVVKIKPAITSDEHVASKLQEVIKSQFSSKAAAYSYMIFILLYIPCISTMAAIQQEFGNAFMIFEIMFLPLFAYTVSFVFYQVMLLFA
ncbi:ferrous iron transport protein B [Sulfurimonas autotrophica]|uniref:Ferrous iron transport protein B n=1 Tax=Sulfurimonas autotrophica (strain ATCC BAA-671 / DSM 16294 / JCM 11897 / OK10) TaxID=563040 RepID=E0UP90_SULAO|nr:ferrous iron transport protein B [Sulfurimonas autotrophica]ADN08554.1 ferrous iron transport protein B [Sulfurimonas autotrophica DSM 16294]